MSLYSPVVTDLSPPVATRTWIRPQRGLGSQGFRYSEVLKSLGEVRLWVNSTFVVVTKVYKSHVQGCWEREVGDFSGVGGFSTDLFAELSQRRE